MTLENIRKGDPMAVYKESRPLGMSLGIAANNLFVALRTAIFGVLASIGTVFIMLYNGIMVGAFQYFFIEKGLFWSSFLTIWIHGTLEISAIIIAGAAGLVAGSGLLFPGTYTRGQAFAVSMRRGLKIFIGVAPIIIVAAFFEGFLTRFTETPDVIRGAFIGVSLLFILWYFVWLPWHKSRRGAFLKNDYDRELPPSRAEQIELRGIKHAGEILSETFTLLRRYVGWLLGGAAAASTIFCAVMFGLSEKPMGQVFPFSAMGNFDNSLLAIGDYYRKDAAVYGPWLQAFLLAGLLCLSSYVLMQPERGAKRVSMGQTIKTHGLAMLWACLFIPVFILLFRVVSDVSIIIFGPPAFVLGAHLMQVSFVEHRHPLSSVVRTLRMFRWGTALVLGSLLMILGLLLILFLGSDLWDMVLRLFSWLVPPGDETMHNFEVVATAFVTNFVIYLFFLLLSLATGLFYFSNKEITDATYLREQIGQVGTKPKIRGLARE
jgi:uncharacterized membrane protein SpoIIM required for sporulation